MYCNCLCKVTGRVLTSIGRRHMYSGRTLFPGSWGLAKLPGNFLVIMLWTPKITIIKWEINQFPPTTTTSTSFPVLWEGGSLGFFPPPMNVVCVFLFLQMMVVLWVWNRGGALEVSGCDQCQSCTAFFEHWVIDAKLLQSLQMLKQRHEHGHPLGYSCTKVNID